MGKNFSVQKSAENLDAPLFCVNEKRGKRGEVREGKVRRQGCGRGKCEKRKRMRKRKGEIGEIM